MKSLPDEKYICMEESKDELFYSDSKKYEYLCENFSISRNSIPLHLDRMVLKGAVPEKNILLVHGITYSSHEFDLNYKDYSFARFLARNGYAVWRLDITGYGRSGHPSNGFIPNSEYASEDINAAVDEIRRVSGREKIDVLGWSWGTVTTAGFAAHYPEKVNKLVLYAPIMSGLGKTETPTEYHKNSWENAAGDFQKTADGEFDLTKTEQQVIDIFCSGCWKYDGEQSPGGGRVDLFVEKEKLLIDLKKLIVPTLIICGDSDPYLDYSRVNTSLDNLPSGSELIIIKGASHAAFLEKPYYEEFRNSVVSFLR